MRAVVLSGPRTVQLVHVPEPEPASGAVRVRIEGCGVCASNLGPWQGVAGMTYPLPAGSPGHEAWGRIDAVGRGVSTRRIGERVALLSGCAYAEYDVAPESAAVALPDFLAGRAFPGEALGCALNIFRRADITAGDRVAIVGIGFLGALLTRLAAHAGAHVIAISRRRFALELAYRLGAATVLRMHDANAVIRAVRELTGGRGCTRVLEAVGKQQPLDLAAELTAEGGRLIIAGYHQDGPRQVNMQLWNWRGIDVINAHERDPAVVRRGVEEAIAAVRAGIIDPAAVCTDTFGLDRLDAALTATERRPDGFLKALITP
jgi:threonine dehydrogenase-like Zn-dependent dehydrogenase